jgi:hypothetical protein
MLIFVLGRAKPIKHETMALLRARGKQKFIQKDGAFPVDRRS